MSVLSSTSLLDPVASYSWQKGNLMSWTILFLAISAGSALLFIYPYLLYPALLRLMRPVARATVSPETDDSGRRFAILFCAYNEAATAGEKVANLAVLKERHPDLEIKVYDDGSTDECVDIYGTRPDVLTVVQGPGRTGKAHGMKKLVDCTERDILVFTDANVMLDANLLSVLADCFSDGEIGGVCGHLEYEYQRKTSTEVVGRGYWSLDERLKRLESRTGNVMGGDGSLFAVRREIYPEFPDTVQDDFTVTMSVIFRGRRLIYEPAAIARERLVSSSKDEFARKVRISARAYHTHLKMAAQVRGMTPFDRWKYVSHKMLRWYGGAFALIAFASFTAAVGLISWPAAGAVVLAACLLLILSGAVARLGSLREIVLALTATLRGVLLASRGQTFATWTPPQTR